MDQQPYLPPASANSFEADIPLLRRGVLNWYKRNRRNLPWCDETDPYRIWVSEVMLQQTQVATVIPYYGRFLQRFPCVEALAQATLTEVLKAWEGLGYYARARNLHKAAQEIITTWNGQFPKTYAQLRTLPGFGPYTAGAVASLVFGEAVPAVDTNVRRVIARLFAIESDVTRGSGARQVHEIATRLVEPQRPRDWTQAIMELGATICTATAPDCPSCPVINLCQSKQQGQEQHLPLKPEKKPRPHYNVAAAVIRQHGKILIAQRPLDGMLGGLWEFPGGKQEPDESLPQCLRREILEELGIDITVGQQITTVKHGFTHFKITLHAFACKLMSGSPQPLGVAAWRWVTPDQFKAFPFARTDLKIIEVLTNYKWSDPA